MSNLKSEVQSLRGREAASAMLGGAVVVGVSEAAARKPAAGTGTIRILCVDDHAVLLEGLAARFAIEQGLELVGRLTSAARLVEEYERLTPDVVILDIEMPGPDAFEAVDRLTHRWSDARVIVLSAHVRDAFITSAFRAGVSGYYSKADDLADIIRGIKEVSRSIRSEFVLGPKVRERCKPLAGSRPGTGAAGAGAAANRGREPVTMLSTLTPRECEILRLIGKGLSRTQIAAELCRSAKTIDAHQARMMRKLRINARADLLRLAIREGLAEA